MILKMKGRLLVGKSVRIALKQNLIKATVRIPVFSHHLRDQIARAGKSHLVSRFKCEDRHALKARLINFGELCALQMLAQKHTKHGGSVLPKRHLQINEKCHN